MTSSTKQPGIILRIIRRLFSMWFISLFLGFFIIASPLFFITLSFNTRFTHDIAHLINTIWGYLVTYPVGVRITRENAGQLKKDRTYIFASNHASYLDIPVCTIGIPVSFRFMGKAELANIPLFGWMFGRLHIPVNRDSRKDSYNSFHKAKEKLAQGVSVLVYPEATIPDKKSVILGRFKEGAFRMAIEHQLPLVPVILIGTNKALPDDGKFVIRPAKIRVVFGDAIETTGMTIEDVPKLRTRVFDLIHSKLVAEKQNEKNRSVE